MNRISRMLMMSGLGIATTLSLGVVPANAASATAQATSSVSNRDRDRDDWRFKDSYDTRRECEWAGRRGEWRDWWEDSYCRRDFDHGDISWDLYVREDDDDHDGHRRHHRHHDDD